MRWLSSAYACSTIDLYPIMSKGDDIDAIIEGGIVWERGSSGDHASSSQKQKTKAKKKAYITGAHGSGSARQKAKYRQQRANRHK